MKRETILKTASESTKTSEVNAQPINRTEQKIADLEKQNQNLEWGKSEKSNRSSFTCYSYQIVK